MSATKLSPEETRWLELPDCCTVLVVYEDFTCEDLAMHLSDRLQLQFGEDLNFKFTWWNFQFLKDPEVSFLAHDAALAADVILFVLHGDSELPPQVKHWIDTWVPERRGREGAVAALMGPSCQPGGATPSLLHLKNAAQRAGLDYLQLSQASTAESLLRLGGHISRLTATPGWDDAARSADADSHWGIND